MLPGKKHGLNDGGNQTEDVAQIFATKFPYDWDPTYKPDAEAVLDPPILKLGTDVPTSILDIFHAVLRYRSKL